MKEYTIPVNFTITLDIDIEAKNEKEAMKLAESIAIEDFYDTFYSGDLEPSDFIAEVQEPK